MLHLTGDSPEFKDALMQSGLGADTAVHGDEVCPAHCKGKCIVDGALPNPFCHLSGGDVGDLDLPLDHLSHAVKDRFLQFSCRTKLHAAGGLPSSLQRNMWNCRHIHIQESNNCHDHPRHIASASNLANCKLGVSLRC